MEIRKVQKTGGSSYVVTLPKDWVTSLKIQEKDSLGLMPQADGTLLISADINKEKIKRTKKIEINDDTDGDYLFRSLIGSYVMGFSFIKITSAGKFDSIYQRKVMEFVQSVIGFEIIEETISSITIKDLLNPTEMPFNKSIKRMGILVRNMHEDVISALRDRDHELAETIESQDMEINRRYRLIARQSNMVLHDIILAQKMGVTLEDAHHYFLISKQLERVGDHAKILARHVIGLIDKKIDKKMIMIIDEASQASLEALNESLSAWEKRNIAMANNCIERIHNVRNLCENITKYGLTASPEISIHLSYIEESIGRTAEYAANIAEIVFDNLLKD